MIKQALASALIVLPATLFAQEEVNYEVGTRFANGIAAIAESKILTVEDIRREIQPYLPQIQNDAQGNPAAFRQLLEQAEDQIIQQLTDDVLIVKDFYEEKGQIPESYIKNELNERLINQFNNSRSEFLDYLQSIGKTPEEYETDIREEIIVNFMRSKARKTAAFVSPVRMEEFYNEHKDQFFNEEAVHLRLIKLNPVADESKDLLLQTADQIVAELNEGKDFGELAMKHSQDSKKAAGGDWGWIKKKSLIPQLSDIAFSLEEGGHSGVIEIKGNIFILKVDERREAGYTPLEDLRDEIEQHLVSSMAQEAQERWLERLRRDGYVRRFN
ncbi:MAG: peptidylprolyl isomerase [Verrucomicrobiota bacterium]